MKILKLTLLSIVCMALAGPTIQAQEKPKTGEKAKPEEKAKPKEETKPEEKAKPKEEAKPSETTPPDAKPEAAPAVKPEPAPAAKPEPAPAPKPEPPPAKPNSPSPMATEDREPIVVEPSPSPQPSSIVVGARLGVFLPQVSSELDTHVLATLEGGYVLPYLEGRLQVFGTLAYTQPENSEKRQDSRLEAAGGEYTFTTIQREFTLEAGILARLLPIRAPFNGYASFAPRIYFLETETYGEAGGEKFGTNYEQSTKIGFSFALGGEMVLGPGRILLQLAFAYSQLQHLFTGNVPTGAMVISAGYRFFF